MFYREIEEKLEKWFKTERKPLIVKGARQVGKTTSILNFCKKHYENVVYIDFRSNRIYNTVFEEDFNIDRITSIITTINNSKFVPYKTIIFFDEIQECSKARSSLKYFYLDKRYDLICSGSLLGIKNYNKDFTRAVGVGFETFLTMYPMSFKEFLLATNNEKYIPYIKESIKSLSEIPTAIHEQLVRFFRTYIIVGGMPEVVNQFIKYNDFNVVMQYQKDILETYIDDFGRNINEANLVLRNEKLFKKITEIFASIPNQLARENKKFKYSLIAHDARSKDYYDALEWLKGAGLIYKVNNLKTIEIPLSFNKADDEFKIYFSDPGLLVPYFGKCVQELLLLGNEGIYKGAIYENAVLNLLIFKGLQPYYYLKAGRLEIDFIIESRNGPIAIEVKATNSKSKSLKTLAASPSYYGQNNTSCIKFYEKNVAYNKETKILNLPYYTLDFIDFDNLNI